jgi:hypothetical protein
VNQRLFVTCSDKGQHHPARLGELEIIPTSDGPDVFYGTNLLGQGKGSGHFRDDSAGIVHDVEHQRFEIRCPRCRRHVQWTDQTARRLVIDLVGQLGSVEGTEGVYQYACAWLDISSIP